MSSTCVVGAQWGDEGKGKVVDLLTARADLVVRYQGGANAGHTVRVREDQFILHQIPSGVLYPGKRCALGNGMVLDPVTFFDELDALDNVALPLRIDGRGARAARRRAAELLDAVFGGR